MVGSDGVGNVFQQDGLTCLGLCNNQTALAFADGGEEVHDTGRDGAAFVSRDVEFFIGEQWGEEVEGYAVAYFFGLTSVDVVDFDEREEFFANLGRPDGA